MEKSFLPKVFKIRYFISMQRVVVKGSWKEREVGKSEMKLERLKLESSSRKWKVRGEVGKFEQELETFQWKARDELGKYK